MKKSFFSGGQKTLKILEKLKILKILNIKRDFNIQGSEYQNFKVIK